MTGRRLAGAAAIVLVVGIAAVLASGAAHHGRSAPRLVDSVDGSAVDFDYEIPAGTGRRIDAGVPVDILPERLVAHVGQTIRVVNDDDRGHVIGPFYVAAGQTLTQTFAAPGTLQGECSVHLSGRFVIEIGP